MTDIFMVSGSQNGPWIGIDEFTTAQKALDSARASFGWPVHYVAKMRTLVASDVLENPEIMRGEVLERVAVRYGGSVSEEFNELFDVHHLYHLVVQSLNKIMKDLKILVPEKIKRYGKNDNVRPNDFADVKQQGIKKPKLSDLIES